MASGLEMSFEDIWAVTPFTAYIGTCLALTGLIIRDLYLARKTISRNKAESSAASPSGARANVFILLAIISLAVTWYYIICYFILSYQSWAAKNDLPPCEDWQTLHLAPWLSDVYLFRDFWEIVLETRPRFFWSQPISFMAAGWGVYMSHEASYRKIPHAWAYMVLAQLVATSFAQCLFYVAVIWHPGPDVVDKAPSTEDTPVSRRKAKKSRHAEKNAVQTTTTEKLAQSVWTPTRIFLGFILYFVFISVASLAWATQTPRFLPLLAVPHVILLLLPLTYDILPRAVGIEHASYREASEYLGMIYFFVSAGLIGFDISVATEIFKFPNTWSTEHRHMLSATPQIEFKSGVARLLHGFGEHPAVGSVATDSIFCMISVFLWLASGGAG